MFNNCKSRRLFIFYILATSGFNRSVENCQCSLNENYRRLILFRDSQLQDLIVQRNYESVQQLKILDA